MGNHQHVIRQNVLHSRNLIRAQELTLSVTLACEGLRTRLSQRSSHLDLLVIFDPLLLSVVIRLKGLVLIRLGVCSHCFV